VADGSAVAVVGISCRLPQASNPSMFWELLREGVDAITDTPSSRWVADGLSNSDSSMPGLLRGGFLDQIDRFDPGFFGISPREAELMDPQQRLILELSWEALEDAGIIASRLAGSQTGVFVGAVSSDYADLLQRHGVEAITRHTLTGIHRGIIANRVSYILGVRGPSLTVDAAQSSALVAIHLACESLRRGESTLALAGGVNLNLSLNSAISASKFGALSPDGRCFTFDVRANGYVRGEGGGVVALKPLSRAVADGNSVYCVIRGSAVNNDGAGDGLTAPDRQAQEEVLRLAYRRAGVKRGDVQYVELHGTGTKLGDQVEAAALGAALGAAKAAGNPLLVGSAKTNVGHLEGAAGIVGLIKAILCIKHREIPPSLNFQEPSPQIPLDKLHLRVQQTLGSWPDLSRPLVAGVSSFGMGGTNCHIVLSQAPLASVKTREGKRVTAAPTAVGMVPWVVSAKDEPALRDQARHLVAHVEELPELSIGDVGYSLAVSRSVFAHRAVVLGCDREGLLEGLNVLSHGDPAANVIEGVAGDGEKVVFLFPGQGSQWEGMAVALLDSSPVFAEHMRACGVALAPHIEWSLEGVLRGEAGAPGLERIDVVQPVLFAVMVSLAALWRACGVQPSVVVGHSQGEIAAAHVAGGLSLEDAAQVAALRSRVLRGLVGRGGIVSVSLGMQELVARLERFGDRVSISAVNGPSSVGVAGDPRALKELLRDLEAEGVRARMVAATVATHSRQAEALRDELLDVCSGISPCSGGVPFFSTVTGGLVDTAELDGEYWYRNMRQPVQFEGVTRALLEHGYRTFVEVSSHPVLTVGLQDTIDETLSDQNDAAVLSSLRRDHGGLERFLTALAEMHVRGVDVDWGAVVVGSSTRRVRLPTYAFQRKRYWLDTRGADASSAVEADVDVREAALREAPVREEFQGSAGTLEICAGDRGLPSKAIPDKSFARRLAGVPESERGRAVLEVVRTQAAIVLGHASSEALSPKRAFKELGFDSPAAVELRTRLRAVTGLHLPTTLLFDHPTSATLADYLLGELTGVHGEAALSAPVAPMDEPIAIVGMSCRYPGGVRSAEQLWELVAAGRDVVAGFPTDRGWDLKNLYDPDPDRPGTSYTHNGGFLYDADEFDAEFFGISPREALAMDPQQRLLLETSWEAFEEASIDPASLRGSQIGVFVGVMTQDYGPRLHDAREGVEGYSLTGNTGSVVSGRVSYAYGLEGPAITVDTACSSSLVALHLACQALQRGECTLALTGGVAVMANPGIFVEFSRQRGLAPDGRCKSFAAAADGTGWSEGVGVVLVERLSDARRLGHPVLAVVRGSAVNQDGASNGLTAPSGPSQQRVIAQALANARLSAADVDVVEAHGTGTKLGDPIEAQALLATYGQDRQRPLWLGSIKSNIGHTQAAAGIAGLIKMVMAIRHGVLPKTLHVDQPSSEIDWTAGSVSLLTQEVPWPRNGEPRRVGVSSFGISGTNAHVILEEAPPESGLVMTEGGVVAPLEEVAPMMDVGPGDGAVPWVISAKSERALRAQAEQLSGFVGARPELGLTDVGFSLTSRSTFEHRMALTGTGRQEMLERLDGFSRGEPMAGVVSGVGASTGKVAFVFSGQGSQWDGMAVELLNSSPVFAEQMRECALALSGYVEWSLEGVLRGDRGEPGLDRVDVVQPLLFAVMVSLAGLWGACGVRPDVVVGHSQGEIAAAYVAGGLSLDDAARVVALRSQALVSLAGQGGMVSVALPVEEVRTRIKPWGERIEIAAVNGPSAVVVSGDLGTLEEWLAGCESDGVRARMIQVDYAAHTVQVEVVRQQLLDGCSAITPRSSDVPFFSSVTSELLDTAELDAAYWYHNLRETVQFERVTRALLGQGHEAFIELSPHPVLTMAVQETVADAVSQPGDVVVTGSLRRDQGGLQRFFSSLGEAWVHGVQVDWAGALRGPRVKRVALPTYAFQRERYWLEAQVRSGDMVSAGQSSAEHPLLGAMVGLADEQRWLFTGRLSLESHPWLSDHAVMGIVLLPGTAFLELALHAGGQLGCEQLVELTLEAPLVVGEHDAVQIQVSLGESDDGGARRVDIYSRVQDTPGELDFEREWTRHASGLLAPRGVQLGGQSVSDGCTTVLAGELWPPDGSELVEIDDLYERLADLGLEYGPTFQGLTAAWRRGEQVFAEVSLDGEQAAQAGRFGVHPALLDAALHAAVLSGLLDSNSESSGGVRLPFSWGGVRLDAHGASRLRVCVSPVVDRDDLSGSATGAVSLVVADERGGPVLSVGSLVTRVVSAEQLPSAHRGHHQSLFCLDWTPVPLVSFSVNGSGEVGEWVLLGDECSSLAEKSRSTGVPVSVYRDLAAFGEALDGGVRAPGVVLFEVFDDVFGGGESGVVGAAHRGAGWVLELLQAWLTDEHFVDRRLVFVTRGAVAARAGDDLGGLVAAPVWGLVRSAQSENPGRFVLVDLDGHESSSGALSAALATGESQLALREGGVLVPRLSRTRSSDQQTVVPFVVQGTVLITGGTGGLGALVARHLAGHGVHELVLASRRGREAHGALELEAELKELGCQVRLVACDVADRDQVAGLVAAIPEDRPLTAVIHAAGVLDDAVVGSLTPEQLEQVMRPKIDAAWHLHELTEHSGLHAFVLFSSMAATFGSPGQANYAAANAFLDALAYHRRARGLAASSLAWGLWAGTSGMTSHLSQRDLARMARSGIAALSSEQGLELFDSAQGMDEALLIAARLDVSALRAQARAGVLPALLNGLVHVPARRALAGGGLAVRLAGVSESEHERVVSELVLEEIAGVLGHASPETVQADRAFTELGVDSLAGVELRNRLNVMTGLRLSATLVFDYPTPLALASHLLEQIAGIQSKSVARPSIAVAVDEPIAIVGMSCRLPGGVSSPEELWELVVDGVDAIGGFPTDRGWDLDGLYDPDPDRPGTSYTRNGGFVYDAGAFDAAFFGIGPREALAMDPQQRVLLEASWEALENAGIDPHALHGTPTGVFTGLMYHDYGTSLSRAQSSDLEGYLGTGQAGSVASGRVAYTLGLKGPTMTIDTACSSSLVAVHLACRSLHAGECSLALAGGATVLASPAVFVDFSRQRGLATDGRCKSFAEAADGTGWGEGVATLVLEPLSAARRNGHQVLALIRGSAMNQDGASNGLTAPNGPSQQQVIAQALANAGLSPSDVDVVEAHGTGTTLGDPIEALAILATYGQDRERPLWLGSIKSNIGHTQAAAGAAGVMKMVMAMRHGVLPGTLHVDAPTSKVDWTAGSVSLLTEKVLWAANGRPRRAGISSFGVSGTNAHLIIEESPSDAVPVASSSARPAVIGRTGQDGVGAPAVPWMISAHGVSALRAQAARLLARVEQRPELDAAGVGMSLAHRTALENRAVVVGADRKALLEAVRALDGSEPSAQTVQGRVGGPGGVVFAFPGQGSQWAGMAIGLLDSSPAFAECLHACGQALSEHVNWSLEEVLRGAPGAPGLERADVVQPALFAVMVSLASLWRDCGVEPTAVVGHSQGEIAAAHVAGGLSLEDAARIVALRSKALAGIAGHGGMVSVALPAGELAQRLEHSDCQVSIAAVNGPSLTVVSGENAALQAFLDACESDGIRARAIPVDYASHSVQIEEIRSELIEAFAPISPRSSEVPFYSTVLGGVVDTSELGPDYWYRNLRETVRFEHATRALLGDGHRTFIEISPHPVLTIALGETTEDVLPDPSEAVLAASLRRGEGGLERFFLSLGEVWVRGVGVDWTAVFAGSGAQRVGLPTYAFQRERYWLEGRAGDGDAASLGQAVSGHPLLGAAVALAGGEQWLFTGRLSLQTHPWLGDHAVMGVVLLPGTAFVELALHAGGEVGCDTVGELTLEVPLVMSDHGAVQLQVWLGDSGESGERTVTIYSRPEVSASELGSEQDWVRHASGVLGTGDVASDRRIESLLVDPWPPPEAVPVEVDGLYDRLADRGLEYGPVFQGLSGVWRRGEEVFAEVTLPEGHELQGERFGLHPALLDAALHAGLSSLDGGEQGQPRLPFSWSGVRVQKAGATSLRARLSPAGNDSMSVVVSDGVGALVVSVESLSTRPVSAEQLQRARSTHIESLFSVDWTPVAIASASSPASELGVLGHDDSRLAEILREAGVPAVTYGDTASFSETVDSDRLPDTVLIDCVLDTDVQDGDRVVGGARAACHRALAVLQRWLADERLSGSRLVFVTRRAIAADDGEVPELCGAPVWGLVRSAQSEHPGRFVLVDVDDDPASWSALGRSLALDEPQLTLRDGGVLVPRLARVTQTSSVPNEAGAFGPGGTVLITGGTGGLGALLAKHLVTEHDVENLLLASRRGADADGAPDLQAELEHLGAKVSVAACDVSDRVQLEALIGSVPDTHSLRGVIHAAGVLDDGVIESLTPERVDRVLAPKIDAAWHLHELTQPLNLTAFVLFSSVSGVLGGPGQANYAAANTFLDALAAHRRSHGQPALSLAWGQWAQVSGMTNTLTSVDHARMTRAGITAVTAEVGLDLFDSACNVDQAVVVPAQIDLKSLRVQAGAGLLPAIMRGLVCVRSRRIVDGVSFARRLAAASHREREALIQDLVQREVATVLGHDSPAAVDAQCAFKDLGFDSLAAVELRNRLNATTGLRLPATLVFDHPTPAMVASHLLAEIEDSKATVATVDAPLGQLERLLSSSSPDEGERKRVATRLEDLLTQLRGPRARTNAGIVAELGSASEDELLGLVERELAASGAPASLNSDKPDSK
jgi:acyl transferase domain-containing protein/acyl carrier protein